MAKNTGGATGRATRAERAFARGQLRREGRNVARFLRGRGPQRATGTNFTDIARNAEQIAQNDAGAARALARARRSGIRVTGASIQRYAWLRRGLIGGQNVTQAGVRRRVAGNRAARGVRGATTFRGGNRAAAAQRAFNLGAGAPTNRPNRASLATRRRVGGAFNQLTNRLGRTPTARQLGNIVARGGRGRRGGRRRRAG